MAVAFAEPTVLAAAKDTLCPDIDAVPDQYAVTETQFTQSTWSGWTVSDELRDRLAPYKTIRLAAGEPDLLGVGMPAPDVLNGDAYGQLWAVLMDLGYAEASRRVQIIRRWGATSCVENDDRCRLDIFNQQIANKLVPTDRIQERSEPFLDADRLTIRLVSNENIFVFKTIAGRDDDIEDMNMLVQTDLDYDVVRDELSEILEALGIADDLRPIDVYEDRVDFRDVIVEYRDSLSAPQSDRQS